MKNRTLWPCRAAEFPKATAKCVLPVPGWPSRQTLDRWVIHSHRASSRTFYLFTDLDAEKSSIGGRLRRGTVRSDSVLDEIGNCQNNPPTAGLQILLHGKVCLAVISSSL